MNLSNDFKCNMCETHDVRLYYYKGTYIYICEHCPNVQFEFIELYDVDTLKEFLYLNEEEKRKYLYEDVKYEEV